MGKRKHKDRKSHSRRKRRREKRYDSDSYSSSSDEYYENDKYHYTRNETQQNPYSRDSINRPDSDFDYDMPLYDSGDSLADCENTRLRSVVSNPKGVDHEIPTAVMVERGNILPPTCSQPDPNAAQAADGATPSTSAETTTLPSEILEALGNPKGKEEVLGPKIPEEIAIRWGRILVDGLTKEQKQDIIERSLVPENFLLAKAPLLNPELFQILSDPAKNRDRLLEKSQNQLGLGISKLTNLASTIIEGKLEKIDILKQISETSQIFLDLHHEDTKRRRKLVISSVDKKFLHMISDVKRDNYLFGVNLGDKIKASKTAERSGLQIKRSDNASTSRKYTHQGNWRGPPRPRVHRAPRQGGHRNRYWSGAIRRPPPPPPPPEPDRRFRAPPPPGRTTANSAKTQ